MHGPQIANDGIIFPVISLSFHKKASGYSYVPNKEHVWQLHTERTKQMPVLIIKNTTSEGPGTLEEEPK